MPGHGNTDRVELEDDLFPLLTRKLHQVLQSGFWDQSAVADLRGARGTRVPPVGPNSFNFMQFLVKFGKIVCWLSNTHPHPSPRVHAPTSGKFWIRHCFVIYIHVNIFVSTLKSIEKLPVSLEITTYM